MSMQQVASNQISAEVPINENFSTLEHQAVYGKDPRSTAGLTHAYYGGRWGGFSVADGTLTLTASSTNYVVVAIATGVISVSTSSTNWNNDTDYVRVYKITTGTSTVSATEDHRAGPGGVHGGAGAVGAGDVDLATDVAGVLPLANGGTGTALTDPNADRILFWDDSAGATAFLTPGTGLSIAGTTLNAATGGDASTNTATSVVGEVALFSDTAGKTLTRATGSGFAKLTSGVLSAVTPASTDISDFAEAVDDRVGALLVAGSNVTLTYNDGAGTLTIAATGASGTAGKHAIYIAAGAMSPSVTGGCAALAGVASASNQPDIRTLDFDTTTEEYAQFGVVMPKSWNEGTVTFAAHWSHASTTTNFGVAWKVQAVAISDDDAIAASYGTAVAVTDTGGTTNDLYTTSESSAITVAGSPAAGDMVFFRVYREPSNGSDTMAVDARLHGITLYITTDAETDA